jgi:serine/threonine-protein kinase
LAFGRLPFAGDSDIESLNATLNLDPPPLTEVVPDFAPEAWRIVAKAMEKEPARRYQSAEEMVTDFRNLERDLDTGRVSLAGTTGATAAAPPTKSNTKRLLGITALVAIAAAIGIWQLRPGTDADEPADAHVATGPTRIVVFPFENLGSPEDEYFSAGVTEEIIGRLASIRDLSVISRTSAFQYDRTGKTLQQVGQDFEVEYVLEGTVRWARSGETNRVRIAPQLVRVADDTSIWAEAYNSPMDDIFRVQSDIAGQVIEALGVVLMGAERASLESRPTENQEAYRAYLRGVDALVRIPTETLAEQMFQRAIDLDSGFANAWAGLSRAHSWRYHGGDRTPGRCEASLSAAEEALRLSPDAPEAHMAMGLYYYRCFRDYERALAEIAIAAAARPNDTDAMSWKATLNKRQGNFEESVRMNQRVLELDPMDSSAAAELAVTYRLAGDLQKAVEAYDLAIAIAPDVSSYYFRKASIYFAWKGTTAEARAALEAMPSSTGELENNAWFWLEFLEGRYAEALARIEAGPETFNDQLTLNVRPALSALCLEQLDKIAEAKTAWQEAVDLLEPQMRERPEDFRIHLDIAVPLAALGRDTEASDAARRAVQMMPISKDAEAARAPRENLVLTYLRLGQYDEAMDAVEALPSGSSLTVPRMRLDPRFRRLVEHPRFVEFAKRSK